MDHPGGSRGRWTARRWAAAAAVLLSACTTAASQERQPAAGAPPAVGAPVPATAVPPPPTAEPTPVPVTTVATTVPAPAVATTTTAAPPSRPVTEQAWTPFAAVGDVVLSHPSRRVERVGFHESNHEGAQQLVALPTAASPATLEARERGTSPHTAADVVMDPTVEVRSPVTGRVKRAGTYVLYCRHSDDYVVIAPDARPAWEVKVLHIDGVRVRPGDRVTAGVTVIAPRPTQLPFESQVDELRTVDPAWPHVHIEVVDPAIKNRPSPNSGC